MSFSAAKLPPSKAPWQHEAAYLSSTGEKTFQHDEELPNLPLPSLQSTLDLYLESVRPHLSEEEYRATRERVRRFQGGAGRELHEALSAHVAKKRNWLEDWWLHYAYLTFREPILPLLNTAGPHPLNLTLWKPCRDLAFKYGSLYLWAFLNFYLALREQRLKPHRTREGRPLSMEQFRWLFNTTRIPGQHADSLLTCWKTKEEGECPQHLVVLCLGHIWTMNPWDCSGQQLTPPELEVQMRHIRSRSEALGPGPGVGALTCDKRDTWAKNRDWLKSLSITNMRNLEHIESSMFVFVMDDSEPGDYNQLMWEGLCGDASNRWADKSLSAIMTGNGYGIMNNDHTPYDAMVSVMMGHYQHLMLSDMGGEWTGTQEVRRDLPLPSILHFDLDLKIMRAIADARETSQAYTSNVCARTFQFSEYGRDALRRHKMHPDSYVQLALQLSYVRLHGRPAPTYETASTRQFYHGRTETIRSCTPDTVAWARTMLDPSATMSEKRHKLLAAVERHNRLREQCEQNAGADRHLFGLYVVALESGSAIPDVFTDPAFTKSGGGGNFVLSTSTVGYTPVFGGVAAMTPHGYGSFYAMLPDRFVFFVSNFRASGESDGEAFEASVKQSLRDMRQVLDAPRASL